MIADHREHDVFGPYELERQLGEGTVGVVWSASHGRLGRKAAIKILRPEHAANRMLINRLIDEARAVNRISHEHVVEIFDFVERGDPPLIYCVMEHLEGQTLSELVAQQPLRVKDIVTVMRQLCAALGAAHRVGVVHRDVKPENVFITSRPGAPLFVKVLDFGVAKLAADLKRAGVARTLQGTLLGTPLFMAPEQIIGLEVDWRADVYATGCLLYQLLAGRLPFEAALLSELTARVVRDTPPPLPARCASGERMPAGLAELALRCLAKRPDERPQTMAAMTEALARPYRVTRMRWTRRPVRRLVAAATVLAAVASWSLVRSGETKQVIARAGESVVKLEKQAVQHDAEGIIAGLVTSAGVAASRLAAAPWADDGESVSQAKLEAARTAFELGELEKARRLYAEARVLRSLPGFLFKIGQCQLKLDEWRAVAFVYRRRLALSFEQERAGFVPREPPVVIDWESDPSAR